ncbi:MAG: hypothetical protein KF745_15465, partial [Phycisphaeraceae bacterium]|nr:hypothetical protein [Phycisphaeraceae bacterium]
HHTTVEALVLWFAEPEIAERLDQIESTIARRTRIVASNFLPAATIALGRSIDEHNSDEAHFPVRPGDQRGLELRRRSRETARRAAALLLRLANFTPGPRRFTSTPRPAPAPSPTPTPSPTLSAPSSLPNSSTPAPRSSTAPAPSPVSTDDTIPPSGPTPPTRSPAPPAHAESCARPRPLVQPATATSPRPVAADSG